MSATVKVSMPLKKGQWIRERETREKFRIRKTFTGEGAWIEYRNSQCVGQIRPDAFDAHFEILK